jgi:RNA polymerase sigma-70 factor (ECF subfamily)
MHVTAEELWSLLNRARQGDDGAATRLHELYERHVRRVVRRQLPERMRTRFDSADFVQSVWGDFFERLRRGQFEFHGPVEFVSFLLTAARGKVTDEVRRQLETDKIDLNREFSLEDVPIVGGLTSPDPTPSQVAIGKEVYEQILRGRPDLHQRVLRLRAKGFTFVEIAAQTGVQERSARRIVDRVERELRQRAALAEQSGIAAASTDAAAPMV